MSLWLAVPILLAAAASSVALIPLRDQHGTEHTLAENRGHVTVAMVVTARRLRDIRAWEVPMRKRYPSLRFVRVADIPRDPPATYARVAERLSKRVPEEISILIDLEGRWSQEFSLDVSQPTLIVIDTTGTAVRLAHGRYETAAYERLCTVLDSLGAGR